MITKLSERYADRLHSVYRLLTIVPCSSQKHKRLHDKALKFYKHYMDKKSQVDVLKKQLEMLAVGMRTGMFGSVHGTPLAQHQRSKSSSRRKRHESPEALTPPDAASKP